jgi:osmotically-inducible protein OsmY
MTLHPRPLLRLAAAVLTASALTATETDERIVTAAQGTYTFKTYLKGDQIMVISRNGAVTLTGKVQDVFHRDLAAETLAGLPGVKSVNNQLSLVGEPSVIGPDAKLRARVQAALLLHRGLSGIGAKVLVKEGQVTLQGEAHSAVQKVLATEYVKGLDGVAGVSNEMTVAKGPHPKRKAIRKKIDDASVTAQVKLALLFNRSTSAIHTKVRTDNGVVTLAGTAGSQAEKDLVTRIVGNLEGIQKVRNRMTVGNILHTP